MSTIEQGKQELYELLQQAIILELSTIPPYMSALLSLKRESNRVPAAIIRSVMMEEMLHMLLAGNILSSIGGTMHFTAENIPSYPLKLQFGSRAIKHREFYVHLAPMSEANITTFTRIELPEGWEPQAVSIQAQAEIDVPEYTIGEYYAMIEEKLEVLCAQYGEDAVFTGDSATQINVNYYWSAGGYPVVIRHLLDAKDAIAEIVEQGEGVPSSVLEGDYQYFGEPEDVAHFFRFREILYQRHYQASDTPHDEPTGEAFEVDYQNVYPLLKNPTSQSYESDADMRALNTEFNRQYSIMLLQIAEAINGQPDVLYDAILNGMHGMVDVAQKMVAKPIRGNLDGEHGAPSYEWVTVENANIEEP